MTTTKRKREQVVLKTLYTHQWPNRDRHLPFILEKVCHVFGSDNLTEEYRSQSIAFLTSKDDSGKPICETRAITRLKDGVVEIDYLKSRQATKMQGNLQEFAPSLAEHKGRLFDVKQEIYRLPDRLIYNLALHYGIFGDGVLRTVDLLLTNGVINPEAASNLKYAVTFANILRLNTYSHNKGQKNDMSPFAAEQFSEDRGRQHEQAFHLSSEDLAEDGALFRYFYTALELHKRLEIFCEKYKALTKDQIERFFQGDGLYADSSLNKGLVHYRLEQYEEARQRLEEAINPALGDALLCHIQILGNVYRYCGDIDKGMSLEMLSLSASQRLYDAYDADLSELIIDKTQLRFMVATSKNNLGAYYGAKGENDKAIECFTQSLELMKAAFPGNSSHPQIASSYGNLGRAYHDQKAYDQAMTCWTIAMQMLWHNSRHPVVDDVARHWGMITRYYSLDPEELMRSMAFFIAAKKNFTDWTVYIGMVDAIPDSDSMLL